MSDFTHARICIRHASGSGEIQAPAGEVTWLDLGCSAVVGGAAGFMSSTSPLSAGIRAEASALERPALPPEFATTTAHAVQVPQVLPPSASGPVTQPAASDADPFGLKR